LLDYDCGSSACSCETASAVLEHHVSSRDSSSKVHRAFFDDCRKTIAVGSHVRNIACRMRDVRIAGVGDELNRAGTGEQSEVSAVTRHRDGRADNIAGLISDEGCDAVSVAGKWTFSSVDGNDIEQ